MDGCMHALCINAWMHDAWMRGCVDAWMDGCMHESGMHASTYVSASLYLKKSTKSTRLSDCIE